MMSEGTTSNQFARRFIDSPPNTVAFVGYTDKETPGFRLRNAKPGEMIQLDAKLPPVELRCRVESFDFSAHATREQLMAYIRQVHAPRVLLVHGEPSAQDWFKRTMNGEMPQVEVLTPEPGVKIDLW
jgi:Cft2 family RNA processing exonuclease